MNILKINVKSTIIVFFLEFFINYSNILSLTSKAIILFCWKVCQMLGWQKMRVLAKYLMKYCPMNRCTGAFCQSHRVGQSSLISISAPNLATRSTFLVKFKKYLVLQMNCANLTNYSLLPAKWKDVIFMMSRKDPVPGITKHRYLIK